MTATEKRIEHTTAKIKIYNSVVTTETSKGSRFSSSAHYTNTATTRPAPHVCAAAARSLIKCGSRRDPARDRSLPQPTPSDGPQAMPQANCSGSSSQSSAYRRGPSTTGVPVLASASSVHGGAAGARGASPEHAASRYGRVSASAADGRSAGSKASIADRSSLHAIVEERWRWNRSREISRWQTMKKIKRWEGLVTTRRNKAVRI